MERWPEGAEERRELVKQFASVGVQVDESPVLGKLTIGRSMDFSRCKELELDQRHCSRGATSSVIDATAPPDDRIIFEMDGLRPFPELYERNRPGDKEQFLRRDPGALSGYQAFTDPQKQNPAPLEGPQGVFLRDLPWWLEAVKDVLRYSKERNFEPGSPRAVALARHMNVSKVIAMNELARTWTEDLSNLVKMETGTTPFKWQGTVGNRTVDVQVFSTNSPNVGHLVVSAPGEERPQGEPDFLRAFYFPIEDGVETSLNAVLKQELGILTDISRQLRATQAALAKERQRLLGQ